MATSGPPSAAAGAGGAPKDSWSEVVGMSSEEAKKKIKEDKPGADVQVVPADAFVTMDYNTDRVRVFVDSNDKVARAPRIG
ncbi:subtilisin inhibitor-like [Miscanthus floridulus]|uniref:subtilisin inhibitor-like n=1 Tax=Miscanthus floridulus TaxID=154761 RepID=UPI0034574A48